MSKPVKNYDEIEAGYYDKVYRRKKGPQSKWHQLKFREVKKQLGSVEWKNLLDVGCGPGSLFSVLWAAGGGGVPGRVITLAARNWLPLQHLCCVIALGRILVG